MVLPLPHWQLLAAMAIVWFATCGCMTILFEYKIERKRAYAICAAAFSALFALCVLMEHLLDGGLFDLWRPVSLFLPLIVFAAIVKDSGRKIFFIYFTVLNICGSIVITSGAVISQLNAPYLMLFPLIIVMFAGMLLLAIKLKAPFRTVVESIGRRHSATALIPAVFSLTNMLLIGVSSTVTGIGILLIYAASFLILFTMCLCYAGIYETMKQSRALTFEQENSRFLREQLRRQRDEMGMFEGSRQTMMRVRHDMRHHGNILLSLLGSGQTEKAAAYINSILETIETGN